MQALTGLNVSVGYNKLGGIVALASTFHTACDKRNDKQDDSGEEDEFPNSDGSAGDASEAENGGDKSDDGVDKI
jgi:hypothetical protein